MAVTRSSPKLRRSSRTPRDGESAPSLRDKSSASKKRKRTGLKSAEVVEEPEVIKMMTRTKTGRLPPPRPESPEPVARPSRPRSPKKPKVAQSVLDSPNGMVQEPLTAYFLVFAQNMQLLLAMIGENGSYMRDMADRYHLSHLSIESDAKVASKHGADLNGRFLYVMMGIESYIKRAVEDLGKVVHCYTGYSPSNELDPRCTLPVVDSDTDCTAALFHAFNTLPVDFVSKGVPPLQKDEEEKVTPPPKRKKRSPSVKPVTMLDVSNAYNYALPHPSVARLLQKDAGATLDELVSFSGLSHLEMRDHEPSLLLIGSVNAIKYATELLCTLIRSQTCFNAWSFDTRLLQRLDPFFDKTEGPADSSSDSGRSSKVCASVTTPDTSLAYSPKMN